MSRQTEPRVCFGVPCIILKLNTYKKSVVSDTQESEVYVIINMAPPPKLEVSLRKYKNEPPSFLTPEPCPSANRARPPIVSKETNIQELKKNYESRLNDSMAKYIQKMKELAKNKNTIKII